MSIKAQMIPYRSLGFDNFSALWTYGKEYFKPSMILCDWAHVYVSNHYRLMLTKKRGTSVNPLWWEAGVIEIWDKKKLARVLFILKFATVAFCWLIRKSRILEPPCPFCDMLVPKWSWLGVVLSKLSVLLVKYLCKNVHRSVMFYF